MSKFVSDKNLITRRVLEQITVDFEPRDLEQALLTWWTNKRAQGGLGLTESGYAALLQAGFEFYDIHYDGETDYYFASIDLLKLDRYLKCPYHLLFEKRNLKSIRLFDSRIASLIHLHGGLRSYINYLGK